MVLLAVCAVLNFTRKRVLGGWLLVLFPAAICLALLVDLGSGPTRLGEASFHSDLRALPYTIAFLAVGFLAAFRPNWRWLFWILWLVSAVICAVMVYLVFFWKVFS